MPNSLTRSQLLSKAKPRFEWIDIEGFGRVGIREVGQFKSARRHFSYYDVRSGAPIASEAAKANTHTIIDQLMVDEETPMFTEADFDEVAELAPAVLEPILAAIQKFNEADSKNGRAGLPSIATNSAETPG